MSVCRYVPDFNLNNTFTLSINSISVAGGKNSFSCWQTPGEFDILYYQINSDQTAQFIDGEVFYDTR